MMRTEKERERERERERYVVTPVAEYLRCGARTPLKHDDDVILATAPLDVTLACADKWVGGL